MPEWLRIVREYLETTALVLGGVGIFVGFVWRRVKAALDVKTAIQDQGESNAREIKAQGEITTRALAEFGKKLEDHARASSSGISRVATQLRTLEECVHETREDVSTIFGHLELERPGRRRSAPTV